MSFDDWVNEFQRVEICYLGPDTLLDEDEGELADQLAKWEGNLNTGSWRRRVNAGGCRNYTCEYRADHAVSIYRLCQFIGGVLNH